MTALLAATAFLLLAIPAAAQTADARWEPFLGCWELTIDNVRAPQPIDPAGQAPLRPRARTATGPRVCVTRSLAGGARFETTLPGQPAVAETIVADGVSRPLADETCRGTQRAEFSGDGLRVYTNAELTCEGDARRREVSGISLLTTNGHWLDIRAVTSGADEAVRVRRYYPADTRASPISRATLAASSLSLDDVKEAAAKVAPAALEAALVETGSGYFLNSSELLALDAAGVPHSVIDVVVALSYPDRFVVERRSSSSGLGFVNDPFMLGWTFGYPVWYDAFYYSPYYYSPFGYRPYDSYPGGGVILTPAPPQLQPSGTARAVDGRGYTRVRPRDATPPETGDSGSRTSSSGSRAAAARTSGGSSGTVSSSGGYSSGGGSGGSSSSGTSSSSGGGSDTGRTAQPR